MVLNDLFTSCLLAPFVYISKKAKAYLHVVINPCAAAIKSLLPIPTYEDEPTTSISRTWYRLPHLRILYVLQGVGRRPLFAAFLDD